MHKLLWLPFLHANVWILPGWFVASEYAWQQHARQKARARASCRAVLPRARVDRSWKLFSALLLSRSTATTSASSTTSLHPPVAIRGILCHSATAATLVMLPLFMSPEKVLLRTRLHTIIEKPGWLPSHPEGSIKTGMEEKQL